MRERALTFLAAALLAAACSEGSSVPPVTPAPPPEWEFRTLDVPIPEIEGLYAHPVHGGVLFATALRRGVWASFDEGVSWTQVLGFGVNEQAIQVDPRDPDVVWAGVWDTLKVSTDTGRSFANVAVFPLPIRSIHVSEVDGAIFVAPQWLADGVPGIFRSTDGGDSFEFFAYGLDGLQILTWDIEEDPASGTLFLANEIADHPRPYDPPLLRSVDRGATWTVVNDPVRWHAQHLAFDPVNGLLHVLLEGPGLWQSPDLGATWEHMTETGGSALLVDPFRPDHVYIGAFAGILQGGLFYSLNGGRDVSFLAFRGITPLAIEMSPDGKVLYVLLPGRLQVADLPERFR